ncbi:MAG: zinc ABC transporter substrate-binding protein, partial [Desulfuromonadales bacterium]|nr:zinc ABC transporter substrate-binding protein [Desulfuromonadales bacterium]
MNMKPLQGLLFLILFVATALPVEARLNVVATTSSMGMLVRTVGGDAVDVTVLAPPDRDAHYLQARPSMLLALRRADLLVTLGAELEIGWLPAALQGAANPRILPGRSGYFEGAAQVP